MLVILGQKDPVPALFGLLDDPKWKDKNFVLFELARLKDPRAVAPIVQELCNAPADYFQFDPESDAQPNAGKTATPASSDSLAAGIAVEQRWKPSPARSRMRPSPGSSGCYRSISAGSAAILAATAFVASLPSILSSSAASLLASMRALAEVA